MERVEACQHTALSREQRQQKPQLDGHQHETDCGARQEQ
jgi:hypothetical protein